MSSERALWRTLRRIQQNAPVEFLRVENTCLKGMPDVNYAAQKSVTQFWKEGWIELKERASWPKRETTQVSIGLSDAQKEWLYERDTKTGRAFILLQCEKDYLLFNGGDAEEVETWTKKEMLSKCVKHWKNSIDALELWFILS